jgi:CDP-glycerol glycerophosphotransferase
VTADLVDAADGRLTVSGPRWPGVAYEGIAWRRFPDESDDPVDTACRVTLDAARWAASIDISEISDLSTLFVGGYAVQCDTFLLSRLPRRVGAYHLCPRSGTLRLETD